MNLHFLMQYVSRSLHTIVRRFDKYDQLSEQACERQDLEDMPDTANFLLSVFDGKTPLLICGSQAVTYALVQGEDSRFIIGPVSLDDYEYLTHHLPDADYPEKWLSKLYKCGIDDLIDNVLLLHNLLHEKTLSNYDIIDHNCLSEKTRHEVIKNFSDIAFENQENLTHHNSYEQERREIASIRNGDTEQLKKSWNEDYTGHVGTLSKNKLRNAKDIGIVLVTLGCRAAMEGGVVPETAYTLSDSYIQKIEEVKTPEAAGQLGREAEYQYTEMVREVREEKEKGSVSEEFPDLRIMRCKEYIFAHLHEKLTTADIADALHINANYLSNLFKKEEGITISQYILNEKVRLAKNMLTYSDYSYSDIAQYLGFSSQSHLGDRFKKITGMTLQQYRNKYGVTETEES